MVSDYSEKLVEEYNKLNEIVKDLRELRNSPLPPPPSFSITLPSGQKIRYSRFPIIEKFATEKAKHIDEMRESPRRKSTS